MDKLAVEIQIIGVNNPILALTKLHNLAAMESGRPIIGDVGFCGAGSVRLTIEICGQGLIGLMRLIATDYQHETNRPTFRTLAD
jgi:hypothetical protein